MACNNNINNRPEKEFQQQEEMSSALYAPELMDAEDSLLEARPALNKAEKNEVFADKLVDKVYLHVKVL